jgi:hypothetical protein
LRCGILALVVAHIERDQVQSGLHVVGPPRDPEHLALGLGDAGGGEVDPEAHGYQAG